MISDKDKQVKDNRNYDALLCPKFFRANGVSYSIRFDPEAAEYVLSAGGKITRLPPSEIGKLGSWMVASDSVLHLLNLQNDSESY